jgi:hypothetical protein
MDLVCWLGLLQKIFTSIYILVSGLCILYHNFYCMCSCYLPLTKPSLRYLYVAAVILTWVDHEPASHRRQQKGKSQVWDSKIWSRVPRDSDPRKTPLARARSIYKRQTHHHIREGTPEKQDRNCQRVINIWSWAPDGARHQDLLIDWPSIGMWLWLWLDMGCWLVNWSVCFS